MTRGVTSQDMAPVPLRASLASLLAFGLVIAGSSCGDGGDGQPPPDENPPVVGVCTGPVPENATLCPGTDSGLTADAPRVVKPFCQATPCSYVCNTGYVAVNGACEAVSPPEDVEFVDNGDGTVSMTDGFGTVVWLRNAHCLETLGGIDPGAGMVTWADALSWTAGLASGACGLTDGSAPGDWQLPALDTLQYLASDLATAGPEAGDLFAGIQETAYWSAFSTCLGYQSAVVIRTGLYEDVTEASRFNVWPYRP